MCLIFISKNHHPEYKLIIAANRDEFYKRQTAPASYWTDHPEVLAGRDLEGMGTWMGITLQGRISLVTNYRDLKNLKSGAPTRGKLVSDYLVDSQSPDSYLKSIEPAGDRYNGFNLIAGNPDELFYFSNYGAEIERVGDGFFGLSNHLLETPWPKVVYGKRKLTPLLQEKKIDPEPLLDALYDDRRAPVHQLPETGVGPEMELALSSMFIKTENYGTRCSTVILVSRRNEVVFAERQYEPGTFQHQTKVFEFRI